MLPERDARSGSRAPFSKRTQRTCAAPMQETIDQPLTMPEETGSLVASAERASQWAGEPFLHPDEDVAQVLAPGTARRRALDDAIAEIEAGRKEPVVRLEDPLRADARPRARAQREAAAPQVRHRAAPPPGRRARRDADRADRRRAAPARGRSRRSRRSTRTKRSTRTATTARTATTRERGARGRRGASAGEATRARSAATASATRPRPARRSPPPASSRPRARSAS